MTRTKLCFALCLYLLLASKASSHEVLIDEHVELIPIPVYDHSYGEASGANALLALDALVATFSEDLKSELFFDLDARERHLWSNLPARSRPRPGLNLHTMSDEQRVLLFEFLSASLGEEGYESVAETMAAEAFLAGDSRSSRQSWAPENYWLSIYGEPSDDDKWAWAFGGHHLALNISMDMGSVTSMSPNFVGAEPAQFTYNGIEFSAIADMHEAGYAVYQSLTAEQKSEATLSRTPRDLAVGAGEDGYVPAPIGISVAELTDQQQLIVMEAVDQWLSHQPDENAAPRMLEVAAELDQTYFAWVGEMSVTSPSYFRIQGPSLVIELLGGMGNVGNSARGLGHYHTVYRNPLMDYGESGAN